MKSCKQDFVSEKRYGKQALYAPYLSDYIQLVKSSKYPVCEDVTLLISKIEHDFVHQDIYLDIGQAERYLSYQKYFPFDLFPWEIFCFVLHNCVYWQDGGQLRWPKLLIYVGRGAGKNGYLGFEDFCLLTPTNGVMHYDIDIFATSEKQAKASWKDVYDILADNEPRMSRFFKWNLEQITNLQTKSVFTYNTSSPKTKDGARPGKVDFDEAHAYESKKLVDVATTGLGKRPHPRRTIISTNGLIRDGWLDELLEDGRECLDPEKDDNGFLPFMCHCESEDDVLNPDMWYKANPSLQYLPDLMHEIKQEFAEYQKRPVENLSFAIKRMNFVPNFTEGEVAGWEDIKATNQPIEYDSLTGRSCVAGIDYMKTNDLLSAGLLFNVDGKDVWVSHSWVCSKSADLSRIKAPLREWEAAGLLTFVDAAEISPEIPCYWLAQEAARLNAQILITGIDYYRYTLLSKALREILYMSSEKGYENILLVRPSNEMMIVPMITSQFVNHKIVTGDNPLFRWAVNNSKLITSKNGNITYGKIEPKSRKTDPFKAYVAAKCAAAKIETVLDNAIPVYPDMPGVFVY